MVQYFPVSCCCDCRLGISDGSPVFSLLLLLFSCYENVNQVASASTGFIGKLTCICWNSHLFQEGCSLRNVIIMDFNLGTQGASTLGRYIQTQVNFAHTVPLSVFSRSFSRATVYCKCLAFCLFVSLNNMTNLCKLYFLIFRSGYPLILGGENECIKVPNL